MSQTQEVFAEIWEKVFKTSTTEFNPMWHNGTGYFDALVNDPLDPDFKIGDRMTSVDENDRRILIIKTRYGNAVFFERDNPIKDGKRSSRICSNVPYNVSPLVSVLLAPHDADEIMHLCSLESYNIGHMIERICTPNRIPRKHVN